LTRIFTNFLPRAATGVVVLAAVLLLLVRIAALRRALKAPYRRIGYRILTSIGRNYTGIDANDWSGTVAIANTERALRGSCRVREKAAGLQLIETPLGNFWIPDLSGEGYDGFLLMVAEELNNHYHFEGAAYVLDCGTNLGTFTRLALNQGAKLVVAIEPTPELTRCLQKTFEQEISTGRVIVVEKGLWNKEERLFLTTSEDCWNNTIRAKDEGQKGVWVSLTTIDKIVEELCLPTVSFIKMDIEGAEIKALEGAGATIRRWRPIISVATEHTEEKLKNTADVVATIKTFGSYSDVCIKGSILRAPLLGVGFPHSVMPEIVMLQPDSAPTA
jgi:FkbM family methyltransferase